MLPEKRKKKVVKLLISTKDGDFWFSVKYGLSITWETFVL